MLILFSFSIHSSAVVKIRKNKVELDTCGIIYKCLENKHEPLSAQKIIHINDGNEKNTEKACIDHPHSHGCTSVFVLVSICLEPCVFLSVALSRIHYITHSKTVFFYLPALPQWVRMINDTQMDSGEKLRWECKAMGRPRPTYRWLRNGLPLMSQVPIVPWNTLLLTSHCTMKHQNI